MADEAVLDAPEMEATDLGDTGEQEVEQPAESDGIDQPVDETETEGEQDETEQEEVEPEPAAKGPEFDGKKLPDAAKKGLNELKAINPQAATALKDSFYAMGASLTQYQQAFEKPADAIAARQMFDQVGGPEGVTAIQSERDEWNEIDASFGEGKPDFYKNLAEANPDAFLKGIPHAINEFASRAPEQYGYYANTVTLNTLASAGLTTKILADTYNNVKADNPVAAGILQEIYQMISPLEAKKAQFEQKRVDPEKEKFQQEKAQFETNRRVEFEQDVDRQARANFAEKLKPEIDRIINGRAVDPAAMKGYQKMVDDELERLLTEVPGIGKQIEAFYRTGNKAESVKYITNIAGPLMAKAAKVIEPYLRSIPASSKRTVTPGAKPAANGGKPAAPAGTVSLREMPSWEQFDANWIQDPKNVAAAMSGSGKLKTGRMASWPV